MSSIRDGFGWTNFRFLDNDPRCDGCGCPESSGEHGMDCHRYAPTNREATV